MSKWTHHLEEQKLLDPVAEDAVMACNRGVDETLVNAAEELHQRIQQATTWTDLEAVLDDAQQQFQAGELTAEDVERLAEIAQQEALTLPENVDQLRLSQLFSETPVRRVRSEVLGEVILFAADHATIPEDNSLVIYRQSELKQLVGCSPERLRAIHASKQVLDGELVEVVDHGGKAIWAEDLLEVAQVEPGRCPTCHRTEWWTKDSGERICGICHPRPRIEQ